jgi:hypothetical protein
MRRAISSALALAAALLLNVAAACAAPSCSDRLQQQLIDARAAPAAQRPTDRTLYIGFYRCLGHSAAAARGLAVLRLQLAQAGEDYAAGKLPPPKYRAFLIDRQRKAEFMRKSVSLARAVGRGDQDGDLVPDRADRCPQTAPFAPTDEAGCDVRCDARPSPTADPVCLAAQPPNSAEDPLRPPLDASVPVNLSCEDVTPAASAPIAWGRRSTSVFSGPPPPFATIDTRSGFYFRVRRTSPQAPGCETWYALQFVFRNPSFPGVPATDIVSVLFSSTEDEDNGDSSIARLPMITNHSRVEGDILKFDNELPLSAGRQRLRDDLLRYSDVSIRVRVVTGAQQASPWSAYASKAEAASIDE